MYFTDVTADSGVDFTYRNGEEAGHYTLLESIGGGVALFDYDGDGLLDIFVCGGGYFGGPDKDQVQGYPCKLYKNLGNFKFKDVTAEVGLDKINFYTHGAAVGDYDKDGWPDLLVTGYSRVALFHNVKDEKTGGRKFVEVTEQAGLHDKLWSTSACFMDLDGKGYPDIYVVHYLDWDLKKKNPVCHLMPDHRRDLCVPDEFYPLPHTLYRNNCDGTFTDVSDNCGLRRDGTIDPNDPEHKPYHVNRDGQLVDNPSEGAEARHGKGLAAMAVDTKNGGKPDIMVANDQTNNFFYLNKSTLGNIVLKEMAVTLGVAADGKGKPTGSMGIAQADYDRSGAPSLFVTTFQRQSPSLYHNSGRRRDGLPQFQYATETSGLLAIGREYVSWGTAFIDIENRGWQDIIEVNGHIFENMPDNTNLQYPVILHNSGEKPFRFAVCTEKGGPFFQEKHRSRGMAYGDLNNDGRIDLVISHVNEPLVILRNFYNSGNHWLGIDLNGSDHRDIIGSRVIVESAQGKQTRYVHSGGSYASSSDPRLVFGLGKDETVDKVTVVWSHNGKEQQVQGLAVDHYWRITEGNDKPERKD